MKHFTLMASMLMAASSAFAAVPFQTTTVTDGKFAVDTKWYTLRLGSQAYYLHAEEADAPITLSGSSDLADTDLWCFAGNETDGFTIYNKAYGAEKCLGAPSNPGASEFGANGQKAYAKVMEHGVAGYSYRWSFSDSPNISGSSYINITGSSNAYLNNRDGFLAFWTAGKDAGSSFVLSLVNGTMEIVDNVCTVMTDPLVTLSSEGGTATQTDAGVSLSAGTWKFNFPAGKVAATVRYETASGEKVVIDNYPYIENNIAIEGPVEFTLMIVDVTNAASPVPHDGTVVFRYEPNCSKYAIVYRIPAITTIETGEYAGRLVALNDYRYCGGDIGGGRIDLHWSYSDDNGATWSRPDDMRNADGKPVARGTGAAGNVITNLDCGFGDPAIVADRESGELFAVACCGRMPFFSSRRNNPQPSARWWSKDGGKTWTEPDYGQWEQIYALFDNNCKYGYIDGQFIGSGRMVQSKRIKTGDYYRIYAVMSGRNVEANNISNWVLYSDDFGRNWHILGDPMNPAVASNGDEPKCEELPDGSVLLAARGNGGNRNFNIFRYTDVAKAEGTWGEHINTNMGMGGINACNGEIMILPVKNKQTGDKHYLALQSFPYGGGRNNVSIAWKALVNPDDYDEPSDFAKWGGHYQVSKMPSAYSTMCLQADNKIGFIYEESTFGSAYCEVFYSLSIETLTGDKFEYCADDDYAVANRMAAEMMKFRLSKNVVSETGYVGTIKEANNDDLQAIIAAFEENPSLDLIASFNSAIVGSYTVIEPENGKFYRFISAHDGAYNYPTDRFLSIKASNKEITTVTKEDFTSTVFRLEAVTDGDGFYVYNPASDSYLPSTQSAIETKMTSVALTQAAPYTFKSDNTGHTSIVCQTPGNKTYPSIHLKSSGGTVVIWTVEAGGSKWYMSAVDDMPEDSIEEIPAVGDETVRVYDLQGRRIVAPVRGNLYITSDKKKLVY